MNLKSGRSIESEQIEVEKSLRRLFNTASDIYVDTTVKECEVKVGVDEFHGRIDRELFEENIRLVMVDYSDVFPYKYVFEYRLT